MPSALPVSIDWNMVTECYVPCENVYARIPDAFLQSPRVMTVAIIQAMGTDINVSFASGAGISAANTVFTLFQGESIVLEGNNQLSRMRFIGNTTAYVYVNLGWRSPAIAGQPA